MLRALRRPREELDDVERARVHMRSGLHSRWEVRTGLRRLAPNAEGRLSGVLRWSQLAPRPRGGRPNLQGRVQGGAKGPDRRRLQRSFQARQAAGEERGRCSSEASHGVRDRVVCRAALQGRLPSIYGRVLQGPPPQVHQGGEGPAPGLLRLLRHQQLLQRPGPEPGQRQAAGVQDAAQGLPRRPGRLHRRRRWLGEDRPGLEHRPVGLPRPPAVDPRELQGSGRHHRHGERHRERARGVRRVRRAGGEARAQALRRGHRGARGP
mmetsp:Transcript_88249/g.197310  ORF Transcript_88249/g.197310 Transcript_88249/m.197310 type:complete len:265 (+) Transcript_88249:154-948(+)